MQKPTSLHEGFEGLVPPVQLISRQVPVFLGHRVTLFVKMPKARFTILCSFVVCVNASCVKDGPPFVVVPGRLERIVHVAAVGLYVAANR